MKKSDDKPTIDLVKLYESMDESVLDRAIATAKEHVARRKKKGPPSGGPGKGRRRLRPRPGA